MRLTTASLLTMSLISGSGCERTEPVQPQAQVETSVSPALRDFWAICLFEGRGVIRENAYNERENARGAAQITPAYLQDSNEWLESHNMKTYTHMEMHDSGKAFLVCQAYWRRYGLNTTEARARCHCAGPDGMDQECSLDYWHGVLSYL